MTPIQQQAVEAVRHLDYVREVNPDGRDEEQAFEQAVNTAFAAIRELADNEGEK